MAEAKATLDASAVAKIARLARIKAPTEELEAMAGELNSLLGWVAQLNEVETDGVAPMASVVDMLLRQRPDLIADGGYPEAIVANARDAAEHFFSVPKVVE
jgi:aspartyl-tRNA(Asn)/glutamyl-tRNA(Gln) amidotransferase subunit C